MSRFHRVAHGVASGYAVLAVTAIYGLASIPMALHYLSKERFGLWALMTTIGGYLTLIDMGMSSSVARLLVDHKDHKQTGQYGTMVATGWLVLAVQGTLIACAGSLLAHPLAALLQITPELKSEFVALVCWQSISLGFGFVLSIFAHVLRAHQRMDIVNYTQMLGLGLNLGVIWAFFAAGFGVLSLAWASMVTAGSVGAAGFCACLALKLLPGKGRWGAVSLSQFKSIFGYGKDLFLVSLGTQLVMASQTMIVTRQLGLQAAATWAVATRPFFLLCQAVWRISDTAGPALSEMIVRGERNGLTDRYRSVFIVTASLAGVSAVIFSVTNSLFVAVWTNGKILWPHWNDALLGVWLIVGTVVHAHNCFVLLTKEIRAMRWVYFAEGIVFVALALLAVPLGGFPALIAASILCGVAFSGAYGVFRISAYFQLPVMQVAASWTWPMVRAGLLLIPPSALALWATQSLSSNTARLAVVGTICLPIALLVFLRVGLPRTVQLELLRRCPPAVFPVLRLIFAVS